jgi:putative glutamine amidotransferase
VNRPVIAVTYSSAELTIFTLWRRMFDGVVEAGGTPLAIDCRQTVPEIEELVARVDGLILGGGGDVDPSRYAGPPDDPTLRGVNPERDENEVRAWRAAREAGIPVLAICRGAQLLTAELGGDLYVDLARDRDDRIEHRNTEDFLSQPAHEVTLDPASRLASWHGGTTRLTVNSQHHQGIKALPPGAIETARADDGLAEGFELAGTNMVAVQWHPEVFWKSDAIHLRLLESFVADAGTYARSVGR